MMKATHCGTLATFPGAPDVYVLEDKRRVISQRGCIKALTSGQKDGGPKEGRDQGKFDRYLERLPEEYRHLSVGPSVEFTLPKGGVATGLDANLFIKVCQAYIQSGLTGKLHPKQMHLAAQAGLILSSVAEVGIVALIDEATGYQVVRAPKDLEDALDRIIAANKGDWFRTWQISVIHSLAPLYGISHDGNRFPGWARGPIGKIYRMLFGRTAMRELARECPTPSFGNNIHQYLTPEARDYLVSQIPIISAIAKTCQSPDEFWRKLSNILKGDMLQLTLLDYGMEG